MTIIHRDAIVYAWAKFEGDEIGVRSLDSSYDTYDREYGWTAQNYRSARGGTDIHLHTVGIGVIFLTTKKNIDVAIRLDRAVTIGITYSGGPVTNEDIEKKIGISPVQILRGRGDTMLFHKSGGKLLDIGKYGIFNTLTGEKLHSSPGGEDKIIAYNGIEIL